MPSAGGAGGGPSVLTGAHGLAIEHADFRAAGRDVHMPVVNINFAGSDSPGLRSTLLGLPNQGPSCPSTLECHASVVTNASGTRDKRGIRWRIARFLMPALHQRVGNEKAAESLRRLEGHPNSRADPPPEQMVEVVRRPVHWFA